MNATRGPGEDDKRILMARLAVGDFMGQQRVEYELAVRVARLMPPSQSVTTMDVGGLRAPTQHRAPLRFLGRSEVVDLRVGDRLYGHVDLVHRMDGRLPPGRNEILTLHDMAFLHFRDEGQVSPLLAGQARRARFVVTVSEFSAQELRREWGLTNVVVVRNGCDESVFNTVAFDEADLRAGGIEPPFVMATGGDTERKNLPFLRQVWARFSATHPHHTLVLAGPDTARRRAIFAGLPRVHHAGFLSREALLSTMAAATAVLVPSTYEGFGLPVIEAMAMGTPVLATNLAALPEVAGDAALLIPPTLAAWGDVLGNLVDDESLRTALSRSGPARARSFSWDRAATELAELYQRC